MRVGINGPQRHTAGSQSGPQLSFDSQRKRELMTMKTWGRKNFKSKSSNCFVATPLLPSSGEPTPISKKLDAHDLETALECLTFVESALTEISLHLSLRTRVRAAQSVKLRNAFSNEQICLECGQASPDRSKKSLPSLSEHEAKEIQE
jgi:hypothetical protein